MLPARAAPALLAATLLASPALAASDFSTAIEGIELRPEVGTGIYGYEATGNVGATSIGLRDFDRRRILLWDGRADLTLGAVANEHPFAMLYGAQATGEAEGGLRLSPPRALSAYASVGLGASLSAVTQSGVPFDGGATVNSLDGLGGVLGSADVRLGFGGSYLKERRSLLFELQPLAEIDSAEANQPALGLFGGALHARYDVLDRFVALGDLSYALAPPRGDAALGIESSTSRWILSGEALQRWGRFFLGLGLSVSRAETVVAYSGGTSFPTVAPILSRLYLLVGFWP